MRVFLPIQICIWPLPLPPSRAILFVSIIVGVQDKALEFSSRVSKWINNNSPMLVSKIYTTILIDLLLHNFIYYDVLLGIFKLKKL